MPEEGLSRRDLLKKAGLGGAAFLGGSVFGYTAQLGTAQAAEEPDYGGGQPHNEHTTVGDDVFSTIYGHGAGPPNGIAADALDGHTFPPPFDASSSGKVREVEISVEERLLEVAYEVQFEAWTYNGAVPGPILRVTEGDVLRVNFKNRTGRAHNLHFHGSHSPDQDGWEPIPAGGETTYVIDAGPAGVHPYHCHTAPLAEHVARGLYGMMIVDPPGGRPPAQEVALLLSGFSTAELGRNGVIAWNGVAGFYHLYPIKVAAGEPVRAFVVNMLEYEPVGSFHLHAETFDVYPAGMGLDPAFRDDTIVLGQGQRAMVEFNLPEPGRYMFHPHQHWLADKGAMGWFAAV